MRHGFVESDCREIRDLIPEFTYRSIRRGKIRAIGRTYYRDMGGLELRVSADGACCCGMCLPVWPSASRG